MAVTATDTARDLIGDALRKIGVVAIDEPMNADQAAAGLRALNRMLKSWQNKGYCTWAKATQSVTLTTAISYTLNPKRPLEILSCRFKQGGVERPMLPFTRDEYDSLPVKTSTGSPTTFHYDRQREDAVLYIWPGMASVNGETLEITYTRELEDLDLASQVDVPGEWYDATVYGLAARMADDYDVNSPNVVGRAEMELRDALAFDREGSVWFHEPR